MTRTSNHTARFLTVFLVLFSVSLSIGFLSIGLVGCGNGYTPSPTAVTITAPASSTVDPGDSASLTATVQNDSNNAGVTWTLTGTGCTGAACGALTNSTTTGVTYTAPASVGTAFSVTITATSVTKTSVTGTVTLNVPVNPAIGTAAGALAGGTVGTAYSVTLAAAGGISPYAWSVTTGTLPAGLILNASTGAITGTPTVAGSPSFTVTLTDSGSPALTATATFSIAIAAPPAITFSTTSLAGGTVGIAYTAAVAATGGAGTLTYSLNSGSLPAGLSLSSAGAIMGKSTAAGTSTFTVKATDAYGDTGTSGSLSIVIVNALAVTTASLPNATEGTAYTATLSASGGTGTGYTWTVTSGTGLSAVGLSLSSSGAVTGTPTVGETAVPFTVQVTDSGGNTATATLALTVLYPVLTITTTNLPNGTVGVAYTTTLSASSGSGTGYTWTVTSGASSLTAVGLSVSSSGVVSGATPIAGTVTFTVQVTDSANNTATASLTVTINPVLTITTTSLSNATEGTAYTATLNASGGTGTGYTWTVTSGTGLSAVGLSLSSSGAVTGAPTAAETAVPFTVQVTDSNGNTATATLALTVTYVPFQGQVLSGQQGVSGATIQIYAVGSAGNGSVATPMLTQPVLTDSAGFFNIAGDYTCGQSSSGTTIPGSNQVYLVATGGTVGTSGSPNSALVMVSVVGPCSNLTSTSYTYINELTTAAAAWALAPFTTSVTNIGATSTNNSGIQNAFLDAALLASPTTGAVAALATNLTIETGKLNALADALNSCVNSSGGSACNPLFTAATPNSGTAPADTFTAAMNIVKNPGQNVAAVYATIPTTPPFATTLTQSPNDWTMSLTVTGGGLVSPTALGIDSQNNIWVVNQDGPLSAFGPQGTPLSSTGYGLVLGVSEINEVYGLAIDTSNNIWVTNTNGGAGAGSVTEFLGATSGSIGSVPQPAGYSDSSISYPYAIAADTNGDLFIANSGTSSATVYNGSGSLVSASLGASSDLDDSPNAIAVDASHGFWLSGDENVAHISSTGALLSNVTCCQQSYGMATDAAGDLWVADYGNGADLHGAIAEVVTDSTGNASLALSRSGIGGIDHPQMVAVDANQNVWLTNRAGNSITEIAGNSGSLTAGTAISPTTGVYGTGGFGLDASLAGPFSIVPDRSGNLWVSNEGAYAATMFFGLAAPTVTPLQPLPTAP